jgi:isopentenyldiphosphate isomerase
MPVEYFDVLDLNGNPAGISRPRDEIHHSGEWHRTVHVWIRNSKNELLIQKRSQSKETWPGRWDISCAGHIAAGESAQTAMTRELDEELGFRAIPENPVFLFCVKHRFSDESRGFYDNEFSDVYLIERDLDSTALKPQASEIDEVKFIPIGELKKAISANDPRFVPHPQEYPRLFRYLGRRHPERQDNKRADTEVRPYKTN